MQGAPFRSLVGEDPICLVVRFKKKKKKRHQWNQLVGKVTLRAPPRAQWCRILLPEQEMWVQSLTWEDPTCLGAAKPMHHNYCACALEPGATAAEPTCHCYWRPSTLEPVLHSKGSHRDGRPVHYERVAAICHNSRKPVGSSEDPPQPKMKLGNNKKNNE